MTLEHVAIWTQNLEQLKDFYVTYFGGLPNEKYNNPQKQFSSYFIRFKSGARLELMSRPDIPVNVNDSIVKQYLELFILPLALIPWTNLTGKPKS